MEGKFKDLKWGTDTEENSCTSCDNGKRLKCWPECEKVVEKHDHDCGDCGRILLVSSIKEKKLTGLRNLKE